MPVSQKKPRIDKLLLNCKMCNSQKGKLTGAGRFSAFPLPPQVRPRSFLWARAQPVKAAQAIQESHVGLLEIFFDVSCPQLESRRTAPKSHPVLCRKGGPAQRKMFRIFFLQVLTNFIGLLKYNVTGGRAFLLLPLPPQVRPRFFMRIWPAHMNLILLMVFARPQPAAAATPI